MGVGFVNFLATTSLILFRRHRGMKRPRPTLHVHLRETTLLLTLAIVVEVIVGETTSWRHDDGDHDDGDHGVMAVTR